MEFVVKLKPIGIVHVGMNDEDVIMSLEGVEGVVEVYPEFIEGLDGIEEYSHIILITYLHKTREEHRRILKVRPRRFRRFGIRIDDLPEVGVFCTDSPHRPNPIGLTIVELIKRNGRFLHVRGLDLFNGTPVLDIKGYTPDRVIKEIRIPEWYKTLERRIEEKFGRKYTI